MPAVVAAFFVTCCSSGVAGGEADRLQDSPPLEEADVCRWRRGRIRRRWEEVGCKGKEVDYSAIIVIVFIIYAFLNTPCFIVKV